MAKPEIYQFDNGATLIYQKDPSFDGSQVAIGFRCGSQLDGKYKGLSHLLEHLLFKDHDQKLGDKIRKQLADNTFFPNAATSASSIEVNFTATNADLEKAIKTVVKMISNRDFSEEEIKREKEIVKQEINMYKDEDYTNNLALIELYSILNKYDERDLLGSPKTLNMVTPALLKEYQKRYFNKQNLVISITSNRPAQEILDICESLIVKKIPNATSNKFIVNLNPNKTEKRNFLVVEPNIPSSNVSINLLLRDRDEYSENPEKEAAQDLIEEYMLNQTRYMLYDKLRIENNLVYNYYAVNEDSGNNKFKRFYAMTSPAKMRKTIKAICELIKDIGTNGFPQEQFEFAKKRLIDLVNARIKKVEKCSATNNFYTYLENMPFVDNKKVLKYLKEMTFEDFNNYVSYAYAAGNISVAVQGSFDVRKMYNLIEIEQMIGNYEHSEELTDLNLPRIESTDLPDDELELLIQDELDRRELSEALTEAVEELTSMPTVDMDDKKTKTEKKKKTDTEKTK